MKDKPAIEPIQGVSTGSTMLNLAIAGNTRWGFDRGGIYVLVGGSASGKTFITLNTLAEASINPAFDEYKLILHAPERGARMDINSFFGPRLAKRLEYRYPATVEEFYFTVDDDVKKSPCISVLDSMDALSDQAEEEKFEKKKKAFRKGKEETGSMGMSKAKVNSSTLRLMVNRLPRNGSILIIICQTRTNVGFTSRYQPETKAGGTALTFYSTAEVWFKVREAIKKEVRNKEREIGSIMRAKVRKNRDTGYKPTVELHHYPSFGFDDVGSCVAFMVEEGEWKESKGEVKVPDFTFQGSREMLIEYIQANELESQLHTLVQDVWDDIVEKSVVNRRNKFHLKGD